MTPDELLALRGTDEYVASGESSDWHDAELSRRRARLAELRAEIAVLEDPSIDPDKAIRDDPERYAQALRDDPSGEQAFDEWLALEVRRRPAKRAPSPRCGPIVRRRTGVRWSRGGGRRRRPAARAAARAEPDDDPGEPEPALALAISNRGRG